MSPILLLISCLILIAIAGVLLWVHLNTLKQDITATWQNLLHKLRLRLDKVPRLIETLKPFMGNQTGTIDQLIALRCDIWPMDKPNRERVKKELEFDLQLQSLMKEAQLQEELRRQTGYLALVEEFQLIGKEIEELSEQYNKKVRHYNSYKIGRFVGAVHMPIFETE